MGFTRERESAMRCKANGSSRVVNLEFYEYA